MGGNAIKNSVPIKVRNARKIATDISDSLYEYFNVPITILGSVMKKSDDMYCGDIDIAIQLPECIKGKTIWVRTFICK